MIEALERFLDGGRREPIVFLCLAAFLFLPGLGNHDLWNPDEPRYLEVSREMAESGQLFVPQLNGDTYTQKPPLLFWSMIVAARLGGGFDETAARLPSALAAIAAVVLVYLLGRRLFDVRVARFSALVYATCAKTLWQARTGQIDMLLGFLVLLAVYFYVRGWLERRRGFYALFFAAAGLATLAKGPVGLLPPLLAIVVFHLLAKDRAALAEMRIGRGLLLWAAVVLVWLVPAILIGGESYLREIVFKQNVTRYMDPWHHFHPWYYYLTVLPSDFFPWFFALPAACAAAWRGLQGEARKRFFFALAWAVVTLVFFSLSPAKRTVYIFQMYPALALATGAGLDALARAWSAGSGPRRAWLTWPAGFLALLMAAAAAVVAIAAGKNPDVAPMGADFPLLAAGVLALLALGFAGAWWHAARGRVTAWVETTAIALIAASLIAFLWLTPRIDTVKSARGLSRELLARAAPEEPYAIYPRLDAGFLVYTRRLSVPTENEEELRAFVARPGPIWLLAKRRVLAELDPPLDLVEVARDRDLTDGYALLTRP